MEEKNFGQILTNLLLHSVSYTMKKMILFFLLAVSMNAKAQWINSLSIFPANPSPSDSVFLIADCNFPSGSCDLHTQGASVMGNNISAWALHCVGMLAYICNHIDTIPLGTLAAGTYVASFQLDHGAGPVPCTPGIVPGPSSTLTFTVGVVTSLPDLQGNSNLLEIYPNPIEDVLIIRNCMSASKKVLYNAQGQVLLCFIGNKTDLQQLPSGIYYLECEGKRQKLIKR